MDRNYYLAFTAGFPIDKAINRFAKKFGIKPETWFIKKNILWVGLNPKRKPEKSQAKNG